MDVERGLLNEQQQQQQQIDQLEGDERFNLRQLDWAINYGVYTINDYYDFDTGYSLGNRDFVLGTDMEIHDFFLCFRNFNPTSYKKDDRYLRCHVDIQFEDNSVRHLIINMADLLIKRNNEVSGINQYSVILAGSEIKVRGSLTNLLLDEPSRRIAIRGRGGYQEKISDDCYAPPSGNCFVSVMRYLFPEMNKIISKWFRGAKRSMYYRGLTHRNVTDFVKYVNGYKSANNYGLEAFILSFRKKNSNCTHIVPSEGRIKRQMYLYLHRDFDLTKRHHWIALMWNPLIKKFNGKWGHKYTYKHMCNILKPYLVYCDDEELNLASGEVVSHTFLRPFSCKPESALTVTYDVESYLIGMYQRFRIKSEAEIHVPFACGYSCINFENNTVGNYSSFYGTCCLREMMDEIAKLCVEKIYLYAHNAARYDNYLVLTELLNNPYIKSKDISIIKTARGFISLSVAYKGVRFVFRDTYLHMSSS